MFDLSLTLLLVLVAGFILACLARWVMAVRALRLDAAEEYATRLSEKPGTVKGLNRDGFIRLYVRSFQPRWTLYAAGGAAAALLISPPALIFVPLVYDWLWRLGGAPEWGGRTGYVFMFSLFFGIVFIWSAVAALFARLHHSRTPEPWSHALARARGEPIPEDTGWRARPKWARRIRPDTPDSQAARDN